MPTERLTTNVLNYLIWRYLQECGFGHAAIELSKAWHRTPESLPFSSRVTNGQLCHMVQDGIELDALQAQMLQAKGINRERHYVFGPDHGPAYSIQSGDPEPELLPHGTTLHPPAYGRSLNGLIQNAQETDTSLPPEPAAKKTPNRKRKGTVSKEQRPAEAMDIDTNGISHLSISAAEGAISDAPSPAVEEPPPPPPTTADIGADKTTQSERAQQLKPEATILKLSPEPSPTPSTNAIEIEHAQFSPTEQKALLLAGKNVARIYIIPTNMNSTTAPDPSSQYLDIAGFSPKFHVLDCAWIAPLDTAVLAVWETHENEKGEKFKSGRLVHISKGTISSDPFTMRTLQGNMKDVVALRWNQSSRSLLCLSVTGRGGYIRVWLDGLETCVPLFSVFHQSFDAQWISDNRFAVCGEQHISIYEVVQVDEEARIKRLESRTHENVTWYKLAYDPITNLIAIASLDTQDLALFEPSKIDELLDQGNDGPTSLGFHHYPAPSTPTAIAFQPIPNPASLAGDAPRLLATAMEDGHIAIFNVREKWTQITRLVLGMGKCCETCVWSPDGFLLAAAGGGRVVIWRAEDILAAHQKQTPVVPRAVWVAKEGVWFQSDARDSPDRLNGVGAVQPADKGTQIDKGKGKEKEVNGAIVANGTDHGSTMDVDEEQSNGSGRNGETRSESEAGDEKVQKLIWDQDGKKLIYTTGDQVAVINLRS